MRVGWLMALFVSLPVLAQSKHPFTFEDMMALKRVEEPVVSPDGKWVLFAAVDVDLKANTKTPHVWVVGLNQDSGSHVSQNQGDMGHPTQEREIISDQDADRPRWAPDGKRFAFISTKENGSQIWIADFDGTRGTVTAKHRLTDIPTEAGGELWSPDGKYILFTSDVYPACVGTVAEEAACNAKRVEDAKDSKVKAQIFTHLLYRHWNAYKEGKRTHLFVVPSPLLFVSSRIAVSVGDVAGPALDLSPGDYDAPVFSLGGQDDYAFSPDGKELCYASNHDAMPAASTNNDLFTVPVDWPADATSAQVIAATKDITTENKAADNTPLYSPDGKYIAYRAQQRPGYESDRWRLMLYDRSTKDSSSLTGDFEDYWVGTFVWNPDSSKIYYVTDHEEGRNEGQQNVVWFRTVKPIKVKPIRLPRGMHGIPMTEYTLVQAIAHGYADDLSITPDGKTVVFTRMSLQFPNEIRRLAIPEKTDTHLDNLPSGDQLTYVNDAVLSRILMSPLETFWFPGANNDDVEGFLIKPPNFDPNKKYPVKFLIHGGPQGAWGDDWSYRWNPELFAAPTASTPSGYVVIMINFHGSTGYGQKFIDAINGDWGGAPFEDLMKGLDYAEQHYPFIDKNRECALGASYGGYMANWILGHTNRFKCIVTHDGMFNTESAYGATEELWFPEWEFKGTPWTNREMYRKWSPHLSAANFKTPTLVIHGQKDYRLDVSQGFDLFTTLQRQGVPSKMLYFPDEGHWVLKPRNSQLWYKTVNDWVDQWTKPSD